MTDVAFAPTWQRRPNRRMRLLVLALAVVGLIAASGPYVLVDERDLACPDGQMAVGVGLMAGAYMCVRDNGGTVPVQRVVPIARRYGLYLERLNLRVFEIDRLSDNYLGPGLNVRVR